MYRRRYPFRRARGGRRVCLRRGEPPRGRLEGQADESARERGGSLIVVIGAAYYKRNASPLCSASSSASLSRPSLGGSLLLNVILGDAPFSVRSFRTDVVCRGEFKTYQAMFRCDISNRGNGVRILVPTTPTNVAIRCNPFQGPLATK